MTIYELAALNRKNGGHFFDKEALQHFGDTLRNFGLVKLNKNTARVYRKRPTHACASGSWLFNTTTGRVVHETT